MSKIESRIGKVLFPDQKIYHFISDFKNFEHLIPKDKVQDWESDGESCTFKVDAVGNIGLRIIEKEEFKLIKIESEGQSPVKFFMWIQLNQVSDNDTRVKITVDPQVNKMIMPIVKKPLKEFVDMVVTRMEELSF